MITAKTLLLMLPARMQQAFVQLSGLYKLKWKSAKKI